MADEEIEPGTGDAEATDDRSQDGAGESEAKHPVKDYSQDFQNLNGSVAQLQEQNKKLLDDLTAHKTELANAREQERRRNLILSGDRDVLKEEQEKRRQAKIKEEFFNIMPEFKELLQNKGQGNGQSSIAENAFFNTARNKAHEFAKTKGFETPEGQQLMAIIGDVLINATPQWKDRFYGKGDMAVLDEVAKFIDDKIFSPRDKAMQQKWVSKVQGQKRYVAPVPTGRGGSATPSNKKNNFDAKNPTDRAKVYEDIYNRVNSGGDE